jgi:hypothetical protein
MDTRYSTELPDGRPERFQRLMTNRGLMTYRGMTAFLAAGLTATSLLAAPTAAARPTCRDTGSATVCQSGGSVSIKATPGTTAPPANLPVFPWLGSPGRGRR